MMVNAVRHTAGSMPEPDLTAALSVCCRLIRFLLNRDLERLILGNRRVPAASRHLTATGAPVNCSAALELGGFVDMSSLASHAAGPLCANRRAAARVCGVPKAVGRSMGFAAARREPLVHTKTATTIGIGETLRAVAAMLGDETDELVETML